MANLAIKGHATRGKEVIEILEMLGGNNISSLRGHSVKCFYLISSTRLNEIVCFDSVPNSYQVFTLEEFLERYPYKIGDRVRVYEFESEVRIDDMKWVGHDIHYQVFTDETEWYTAEELNEFNEPTKPYKEQETMEEQIKLTIPKGYKFSGVDNHQVVFDKVKPQYPPKTYEECCKVLNISKSSTLCVESESKGIVTNCAYSCSLVHKLSNFRKLLICRDAYWKLTGEQLDLGKHWEPDWTDNNIKYVITFVENKIYTDVSYIFNYVLSFPTAEMRDAFYENFKDLIEQCKELL